MLLHQGQSGALQVLLIGTVARRASDVSRQHRISNPRHQSAIDHRHLRVLRLHSSDQRGRRRPLQPCDCRYVRYRTARSKYGSIPIAAALSDDSDVRIGCSIKSKHCFLITAPPSSDGAVTSLNLGPLNGRPCFFVSGAQHPPSGALTTNQ